MKLLILFLSSAVALFAQASAAGTIWTFLGPTTLQSAATANGNGTAMTVAGLSSSIFSVNCSVSCSGGTTINFEGSADGTNYSFLPAVQVSSATIANSIANQASGSVTLWQVPIGAIQSIRARISGYSAGTITVTATASAAPYDPKVLNSNLFLAATAADGNSGNKSASTQRIVIATDQPALTNALLVNGSGVTQPVSGTFFQATQPVSAASLPLPTGASTAAKQPALGTAGTASSDVISVQGIASMTALKVDGSAVTQPVSGTFFQATQPVSGTVTANIGTSGSLALDASVTGLQVSQGSTTSGQKSELAAGAVTTAAPSYTTAQTSPLSLTTAGALRVDNSANTQPVSGTVTANAGTGTMAVSAASLPLPSGAATSAKQPALGTAGTASSDVLSVQGIASMTALKVDGSAVTQPVSGTITANAGTGTMAISAASLPLPTSAATDASVTGLQVAQASTTSGQKGTLSLGAVTTAAPSYTTAQSSPLSLTTAGSLRVDNSANTQPVSGTVSITTNSAVNVAQINGVATTMGNGVSGTGVQRVTLASDSTGQVALATGSNTIGALTANQSVNIAQMNGVATTMGNGVSGTGVQRVSISSDNTAIANAGQAAIGAAPPTGSVQIAGTASGATAGLLAGITVCDSFANIQQTAGAQIVTGVSGRRIYICSINLISATAQNVSVVAGTGTVCATTTVAVPGLSGGATAATGWNLAANGGIAHGGGLGTIAKTTVNADNLCILQSSTGQVSGGLSYAIY